MPNEEQEKKWNAYLELWESLQELERQLEFAEVDALPIRKELEQKREKALRTAKMLFPLVCQEMRQALEKNEVNPAVVKRSLDKLRITASRWLSKEQWSLLNECYALLRAYHFKAFIQALVAKRTPHRSTAWLWASAVILAAIATCLVLLVGYATGAHLDFGKLSATSVALVSSSPALAKTPTPAGIETPFPTPTSPPGPTATPTSSPTPTATSTSPPGPTATPTSPPTPTVTPTSPPGPTATPTLPPTPTAAPTSPPTPTAAPTSPPQPGVYVEKVNIIPQSPKQGEPFTIELATLVVLEHEPPATLYTIFDIYDSTRPNPPKLRPSSDPVIGEKQQTITIKFEDIKLDEGEYSGKLTYDFNQPPNYAGTARKDISSEEFWSFTFEVGPPQ